MLGLEKTRPATSGHRHVTCFKSFSIFALDVIFIFIQNLSQ